VASLGGSKQPTSTTHAGAGDDWRKALNWARCMRQHGIDLPDPKPGGGIDMRGVNSDTPKFQAAEQACQQYQPNRGEQSSGGAGK
jgi:hypothetical protein